MSLNSALHRARGRLRADLFVQEPQQPHPTAKRALIWVAAGAAGIAIQLVRIWPSDPLGTLWAEDGGVWLTDALNRDFPEILGTPYNGYLQTASRLVAEAVSNLPVQAYPVAMALAGTAIVAGCAYVTWRASAGPIKDPAVRAALAAMVILVPVANAETLGNVTNSIWFLLFACFWILLWVPSSTRSALLAGAIALMAALSTIGCLFLLPLWGLRVLAIRDRREYLIAGGFIIGVGLQLAVSWGTLATGLGSHDEVLAAIPAGEPFSTQPYWDWELIPAFAQRVVGGTLAGQPANAFLWEELSIPYGVVLALATLGLLAAALREPRIRLLVPLTILLAAGLFLITGYRRWGLGGDALYWPVGESNDSSSRYLITPVLLMASAISIWVAAMRRRDVESVRSDTPSGVLPLVVGMGVLAFALASFAVANSTVRGSLPFSEALADARERCDSGAVRVRAPLFNGLANDPLPLELPCEKLE